MIEKAYFFCFRPYTAIVQSKALKYTVEGESLGAMRVKKINTDGDTYIEYVTSEGTLSLNDQGDTFKYSGSQDAGEVECN